ncbi:hypothetical protein BCV69DRAFT_279563 [Microstroma glucosiphilum]|uniref:Uncharacterized protein n=1 Tax=Pseudomicrostroma glucosiphilum TaxID=1684307 RepID=A0A316UEI8_9BASI|nr:hypothetical protein BCV69DRAFT_279563 [Pseudomicrostroma glucosiphilum]PWN23630.1 hypothetical protein BCV69DRAFT_279563 [Pseudomicrostroma glucosiphilum]
MATAATCLTTPFSSTAALMNPSAPTTPDRQHPSSPARSHVRKSSLTLFKIAASASGKDLAAHSPISPPRAVPEKKATSPTSRAASDQPPISPSASSRRFSFGFGAANRGPAAGPSSPRPSADAQPATDLSSSGSPTEEAVRCHVVDDDDILLPFLERADEVRDLLFDSPANASIAARLRTWASIRGSVGDDLIHTLTNVDRSELDDARWIATLRSVLVKEVPDLWADLALTLGADGSTFAVPDSQVKSFEHGLPFDDDAVDDASDLSSVTPLPHESGQGRIHSRSVSRSSILSGDFERHPEGRKEQEPSSLEVEGLHYLPAGYNKAISQIEKPSYPSDEEQELTTNKADADASAPAASTSPASQEPGRPTTSIDTASKSSGVSQPRSRGMSVSLSSPPPSPRAPFDASKKLASQSFAGLRLRSSSVMEKEEDKDYLAGSAEASPRARRRAARAVESEAKPLTIQHSRRLSDLVGGQPDAHSERQRPTALRVPSGPHVEGTSAKEPPNKKLTNLRPTAATPSLDDEELLRPQKSKLSFARDFEGPTGSDPRHHGRPKAYSMTQYSSHVEQTRLEAGKAASITPYEAAAAYEASGVDKPADLGVLKDGRTRHPSSGKTENASVVAAFRASLGLTPGTSSLSPINSNPSSGGGSPSSVGSGAVTPVTKDGKATVSPRVELKEPLPVTETTDAQSGQESIQAALSSPPHIHRRPGGFGSFSAELEALQKRSRARSDAAFSSGSQAVASSSEGSAVSDSGVDEDDTAEDAAIASAASSLKGSMPSGDFDLDFGDKQAETSGGNSAESQPSVQTPSTPPLKKQVSSTSSPSQTAAAFSPRSPRSARGDDHIIVPIPPGGPRSRAQAMSALWRRSDVQYLVASMKMAIGNEGWLKARDVMTTVERDTLSDKALLETLATESFKLVDLDSQDPRDRERAEKIMCGEISEEEQAEYSKKWKAFELLLSEGLCVPSSSLQEAKRRCALHL